MSLAGSNIQPCNRVLPVIKKLKAYKQSLTVHWSIVHESLSANNGYTFDIIIDKNLTI